MDEFLANTVVDIAECTPGQTLKVTGFCACNPHVRQKLLALGITTGTTLTFVRRAPLGDPLEILVRGSHFSLRLRELACLQLVAQA